MFSERRKYQGKHIGNTKKARQRKGKGKGRAKDQRCMYSNYFFRNPAMKPPNRTSLQEASRELSHSPSPSPPSPSLHFSRFAFFLRRFAFGSRCRSVLLLLLLLLMLTACISFYSLFVFFHFSRRCSFKLIWHEREG